MLLGPLWRDILDSGTEGPSPGGSGEYGVGVAGGRSAGVHGHDHADHGEQPRPGQGEDGSAEAEQEGTEDRTADREAACTADSSPVAKPTAGRAGEVSDSRGQPQSHSMDTPERVTSRRLR